MTKNVLVVSKNNLGQNGVSHVIFNLLSNIRNNDLSFILLVPKIDDQSILTKFRDINVCVKEHGIKYINVLKYYIFLYKTIKKNKIDVIHIHGSSRTIILELMISKISGVKIRISHSHNSSAKMKFLHHLLKYPFLYLYTNALSCGIKAGTWMYGSRKYSVINNGIDLEKFRFSHSNRMNIRDELNIENRIIIGHVGAFNSQKNQKYLIDIIESLSMMNSDWLLLSIGEGTYKDEIINDVKKRNLGNNVMFLDNRNDVYKFYSAFDIFVLPSIFEGFPLVLIEAQANGLECYVSDNVSNEVNLTGLVHFLPLLDFRIWVTMVEKRNFDEDRLRVSEASIDNLRKEKYDIIESSKFIEKIYDNSR